jgi:hypothetical protein
MITGYHWGFAWFDSRPFHDNTGITLGLSKQSRTTLPTQVLTFDCPIITLLVN